MERQHANPTQQEKLIERVAKVCDDVEAKRKNMSHFDAHDAVSRL